MSSIKSLTGSVIPVDSTITGSTGVQLTLADRDSTSATYTQTKTKKKNGNLKLFYPNKQTNKRNVLILGKRKTTKLSL